MSARDAARCLACHTSASISLRRRNEPTGGWEGSMREKRVGVREPKTLRERVKALRRTAAIQWSGRRLRPAKPVGKIRGSRTVADLVIENRE
jgi:hypothetical protein